MEQLKKALVRKQEEQLITRVDERFYILEQPAAASPLEIWGVAARRDERDIAESVQQKLAMEDSDRSRFLLVRGINSVERRPDVPAREEDLAMTKGIKTEDQSQTILRLVQKMMPIEVKQVDEVNRRITLIITATQVDRDGDVVVAAGVRVDSYLRNPIVLFSHMPFFPVANTTQLIMRPTEIEAEIEFFSREESELAHRLFLLYSRGKMKAASIGFLPINVDDKPILDGQTGRTFLETELLEFSLVAVPSLREALSTENMLPAYKMLFGPLTEEMLNDPTGAFLDVEDRRVSDPPIEGHIIDLDAVLAEEKTVVPFSIHGSLSLQNVDKPWDGGRQVAAWRKAVGGPSVEKMDFRRFAQMFAWRDADAVSGKKLSGFKLPHHEAIEVEGKLAHHFRGTVASMGVLLGARGGVDIPDNERRGVYNHLAAEYKAFDRDPPAFSSKKEFDIVAFVLQHIKEIVTPYAELDEAIGIVIVDESDETVKIFDANDTDGILRWFKENINTIKQTKIQSLVLSKEKFKTLASARKWVLDHEFKADKVDETEQSWRFRQFPPEQCIDGSFRTIPLEDGVSAVICRPKEASTDPEEQKLFPMNDRRLTVQDTFRSMGEMGRKYTQGEAAFRSPSENSVATCGSCRFYLRDPAGGPIGRCAVVDGEIPWFATTDFYINANAEAVANFAAGGEGYARDLDGKIQSKSGRVVSQQNMSRLRKSIGLITEVVQDEEERREEGDKTGMTAEELEQMEREAGGILETIQIEELAKHAREMKTT